VAQAFCFCFWCLNWDQTASVSYRP
jgi:hypothetical protein